MDGYKFVTKPRAHNDAIVTGSNYRFTVLTDRLLRYEWAHDGQFEDRASTFAIHRDLPVPKFDTVDSENELEIITDHFHLSYDKKRFSPSGLTVNFSAKVTLWGAQWRYGIDAPTMGGTARTLDGVDGRCDMGQGVISRDGFANIDDSSSMLFDGHGFVAGRPPGDRVDGYLFCYGHDYKAAIKAFYAISGKQPVLPRWSLGNWWSRYYRYTQQEYIDLMDQFHEHRVPLSVAVVDMDWHLVNDDRVPHAGWTGYTWDDKLFPDPPSFGRELHARNLKITLNDHPHSGIHRHEDAYEEMARALDHDISKKKPILFDPTSPRFMKAFLNILHRNIEKVACDFWWIDWQQGPYSKVPGVDPLWLLNHFQFLDSEQESGQHGIIFSRFAGPGSHRYPVGFSGDTIVTWASLAFQSEFTATASNIGYGWWSHDIGGHMGGGRDDELVTRWVQLGVFSPLMRLHSSNNEWGSKEPWLYRRDCGQVIEEYMRLRHRLIPYLYTNNVRSAVDDEPLVQPMYWAHPDLSEAYEVPNQFQFGADLLVAPIVTPRDPRTNLASVKFWFPPTHRRFVDFFNGQVYDGNRALTLYRPLDHIPVLAPEGSIIPLDAADAPDNGGFNPSSLEILVVVGQDAKTTIVEEAANDANATVDVFSGETRRSEITYTQSTGKLTAKLVGPRSSIAFKFFGIAKKPHLNINYNGDNVAESDSRLVVSVENGAKKPTTLVVALDLKSSTTPDETHTLTIEIGPDPQLNSPALLPRLHALLLDYQTDFGVKDQIWQLVNNKTAPLGSRVGQLLNLGLEENLVGPVAELLLADSRL